MDSVNFLFIYITWLITSVDSQVISARVGSTVVLPCDLSGLPKPSMYIQWRTDFDVVFERSRRESYQGERYKGRVNVPEEHLFKGNCSLVLRNVEFNDAGVYYTYLFMKRSKRSIARFIQRVKLKVYEDAGPTLSLPFLVFSLIVVGTRVTSSAGQGERVASSTGPAHGATSSVASYDEVESPTESGIGEMSFTGQGCEAMSKKG
ncbi:hypothetical protein KOW79_012658 [Hemibagrus wyckioides]|uniref:Ig-like domain-containing protein n=1 Tax=Hemibagrus wyckioides TaxID=337641 RepID=A0A9D3NLX9_9TELE|nr:hypothetical protein KOW79_012658 [Hemibagrus wyckioides]